MKNKIKIDSLASTFILKMPFQMYKIFFTCNVQYKDIFIACKVVDPMYSSASSFTTIVLVIVVIVLIKWESSLTLEFVLHLHCIWDEKWKKINKNVFN